MENVLRDMRVLLDRLCGVDYVCASTLVFVECELHWHFKMADVTNFLERHMHACRLDYSCLSLFDASQTLHGTVVLRLATEIHRV